MGRAKSTKARHKGPRKMSRAREWDRATGEEAEDFGGDEWPVRVDCSGWAEGGGQWPVGSS